MLGKRDFAPSHRRLPLKSGKRRTVLTTGAALDTFFQLIFNPLEGIYIFVSHPENLST
jgi:hypothetical protein